MYTPLANFPETQKTPVPSFLHVRIILVRYGQEFRYLFAPAAPNLASSAPNICIPDPNVRRASELETLIASAPD